MLVNFKMNPALSQRICDVEFYQMPLNRLVDSVIKTDSDVRDLFDTLPSWSKTAAFPAKAKGFLTKALAAVFLGQGNFPELNFSYQVAPRPKNSEKRRVAMLFLPGSITVENTRITGEFANETIGSGWEIVVVTGETTTNAEAERHVKRILKEHKTRNILIISRGMAQRSFSVPEINELYLAYDSGEAGCTLQKMSRTLTPYFDGRFKVGRIVSLSFDPNRNDVFDAAMLVTAVNIAKKKSIPMKKALETVLHTIDIFHCTPDNLVRFDTDKYLAEVIARKSVDRVIGKVFDMSVLTEADIVRLASGEKEYTKLTKTQATLKGKTRNQSPTIMPRSQIGKPITEKQIEDARKALVVLSENIDIIIYGTRSKSLKAAFAVLDKSMIMQQAIEDQFNMQYDFIRHLFTCGGISDQVISLKFDQ